MDWRELKKNPQKWELVRERAAIIARSRSFFSALDFLEVQTPLLVPSLIPESYLEVFTTTVKDGLGGERLAFLTPSPEMWHKKLLAAGAERIFEITKSFRNADGGTPRHNPEFTMLEWYRTRADYRRTMKDCEQLVQLLGGKEIRYQNTVIQLEPPFERLTVTEAFARWAKVDKQTLFDPEGLVRLAVNRGYTVSQKPDWETIFNLIYVKEVEPHLGIGRPTFLYDYPAAFAPLAKTSVVDSKVKERFELYLAGVELADGYSELTDAVKQKEEFASEQAKRHARGLQASLIDEDFLEALKEGLPVCSGVALGIDRLLMILLDKNSIDEVTLFTAREIFNFS